VIDHLPQHSREVVSPHQKRRGVLQFDKPWLGTVSLRLIDRFSYKASQSEEFMFDKIDADFGTKKSMKAKRVQAVDTQAFAPVKNLMVDGIRYDFQHQLGVGAFTRVYKAVDEWGNALAIKVYPSQVRADLWQNEVRQLKRFAGEGVAYLHRVFVHEDNTYLVLSDGGVPVSRCRFVSEKDRRKVVIFIAQRLLQLLHRMHEAGYYHGDVNPQNVLIQYDKHQTLTAMTLIDFAFCRSHLHLENGNVPMAQWAPPPEFFSKNELLGPSLDIWHVGVLLLQLIKGETLDYSEADILAGKPREDALALAHPTAMAIATAMHADPTFRPDALSLWRSVRAKISNHSQ
jgi:serine/threonine protein kinase